MPSLNSALLLLATLAAFPLQAEDTLALDRFSVSLGEYQTNLSAEASIKRTDEDARTRQFGASTGPALAFFELGYRPFERHSFRAAWFDHDRSTTRTLFDDVEYGDATYPVGATLAGTLAVKVLEVDYTYWTWLTRRNAFGPVVGIVRIGVDTALSGTVDIEDIGTVDLASEAGESIVAPKIGFSYAHAFDERLRLTADVGTFERSISRGEARIWDAAIGVEWYPWEHAGFALRHARTRIDADLERSGYDGSAELEFGGWQLLVRARW